VSNRGAKFQLRVGVQALRGLAVAGFISGLIFTTEQVAKTFHYATPIDVLYKIGLGSSGWEMFTHGLEAAVETQILHLKTDGQTSVEGIKSVHDGFWRRSYRREILEGVILSKAGNAYDERVCTGFENRCTPGDRELQFQFRRIPITGYRLDENLQNLPPFQTRLSCRCE